MFKKIFILILLLFLLIPVSFAVSNDTDSLQDDSNSDILTSNDYYFNVSTTADGDGSVDLPYKDLKNNVKANSVNHIANGNYSIDDDLLISDVTFIGEDTEKTIINCNYNVLNVSKYFTLINVTLVDFTILNNGVLNAQNTVFSYGYGHHLDKYQNSFGGAIYTKYNIDKHYKVNIDNCTFENNYAEYGGAIFMDYGELNVVNSRFINNSAYNYGGAIAGEYGAKISINNTVFINDNSISDAGGAIYLKESSLDANKISFENCSATFGAGITALNSDLTLYKITGENNTASFEGGVIYQMYGNISILQSTFIKNNAKNGGALFLDNLTESLVASNLFRQNTAASGGAIYSIMCPKLTFKNEQKSDTDTIYESDVYDFTSIGRGNYTIYINNDTFNGELPSYYNLKDHGYVSSVKNQMYGGNCWAFSALASLESCILKASGKELDLSEENMKNLIELYSDYGWSMDTNDGGYTGMGIGYLTGWLGPINDINDTYDDYSVLSPLYDSLMHVQNILFLKRNNVTDNDAIKKAIMKYGAVATGICYSDSYLNGNSYYYYSIFGYTNHAVTIVGWDDNYSKSNFYGNPEYDGAWIVKNSWGESWGDNGYFYVSYCDRKLAQVGIEESSFTFILNDSKKYDKNYQYDVIGKTSYYGSNQNEIWYQNTFTATDNEFLSAVSTFFEKECIWNLSVYVNDKLALTQSGNTDAGYYTIQLDKPLALYSGDSFKIVFKVSGDAYFSVPISEKAFTNKFLSHEGVSYFSYDGKNWFDLYTTLSPGVASIKAFTQLKKLDSAIEFNIKNNQKNPVEIIVNVFDEYKNPVRQGNLTVTVENTNYNVEVVNGVAKVYHKFKNGGLNNVSAEFNGLLYNEATNSVLTNVNVKKTRLIASDLSTYYKSSKYFKVKLVDENNKVLANKKIQFTVNSKVYTKYTNANGIATLNNKLKIGKYKVSVSFSGDSSYISSVKVNKVTIKSTLITSDKTVKKSKTVKFNAKLVNSNGKVLKSKKITFKIKNKEYTALTNKKGIATVAIKNLKVGKYTITTSYSGIKVSNNIIVKN